MYDTGFQMLFMVQFVLTIGVKNGAMKLVNKWIIWKWTMTPFKTLPWTPRNTSSSTTRWLLKTSTPYKRLAQMMINLAFRPSTSIAEHLVRKCAYIDTYNTRASIAHLIVIICRNKQYIWWCDTLGRPIYLLNIVFFLLFQNAGDGTWAITWPPNWPEMLKIILSQMKSDGHL